MSNETTTTIDYSVEAQTRQIRRVAAVVEEAYGLAPGTLCAAGGSGRHASEARTVAIWLARDLVRAIYTVIAPACGRSLTAVSNAARQAARRRANDPVFRARSDAIRRRVTAEIVNQ